MSLLYLLDLIGTAAFAASGAWAGIRRRMDLLGVLVLGVVTATGGGTLRDILLGDVPPFSFKDETYLYISIAVSLVVFFWHRRMEFIQHPLLYFDAVGLGTFVVIGTSKALAFETGFLVAVVLGVMTATAGGVIRDVLSNQVPLILRKEVYASACIAGAVLLVLLHRLDAPPTLAALSAAVVVIAVRLLAIHFNWALPRAKE
ncbi:trimeric intracellular cation channel family protein [Geoalkalibacter halelectricus]|uniref:Trimeric intracellular cation channel family protein n=1 Tax=Geoalkalibacter halelectricus TaxID=2847045 RepID=A0ABY5ZPY2_9BACT|nr:trimeric intracellular cation channel family protein [Geoalkalibacter halelectricus]MDO3378748.1 trimeric intracellular cation channel family protein [Geoalkalibacter halelectricus]UWZ79945.1 trimeric intracellular cation channel family protein [Geoalkalibacter halelectricus]